MAIPGIIILFTATSVWWKALRCVQVIISLGLQRMTKDATSNAARTADLDPGNLLLRKLLFISPVPSAFVLTHFDTIWLFLFQLKTFSPTYNQKNTTFLLILLYVISTYLSNTHVHYEEIEKRCFFFLRHATAVLTPCMFSLFRLTM